MKRQGGFFDKIISFKNLLIATKKATRGKKHKRTVSLFCFNLENELIRLHEELKLGLYKPSDYRTFEIKDPKPRLICCSDFRDRVVHHAIFNILEDVFEKKMIYDSYACRKGKGSHAALSRANVFCKQYGFYLKCDIKKYFDSIEHTRLKALLRKVLKERALLNLLDIIIDHSVIGSEPGRGIPIGNLSSQHFSNFYLSELDHFLKDRLRIKAYVRYMDDMLLFSNNKDELNYYLNEIREFIASSLELNLKEKVTHIAPVTEGIPFLGFRLYPNLIRLQRSSLTRFRRNKTLKEKLYKKGRISEVELLRSMNSMIGHISNGNTMQLRRKEFGYL